MTELPCITTWSIDHHESVLSEQRRIGPHAADFQERIGAAHLDPDAQVPVETTRRFQIGGAPILWFNQAKTEAVVNAAVLTDLLVADPTRLNEGQRVELGRLTEVGRDHLGHDGVSERELIEFLIRARAIATYWHIGAELCLRREEKAGAAYRADFDGVHTYFTNEENRQEFAFSVEITADGAIAVIGGAQR